MAALHLSEQPVEKQIELFKEYQHQESHRFEVGNDQSHTHFQTVVRFLAGLGKFTNYSTSSTRSIVALDSDDYSSLVPSPLAAVRQKLGWEGLGTSLDSSRKLWISLDGLQWMFEARFCNVIDGIEGSVVGVHLYMSGGIVTSFESFVLGYCVSHSNCPWEIDLGLCCIGDEGVAMLVRGAMEGS